MHNQISGHTVILSLWFSLSLPRLWCGGILALFMVIVPMWKAGRRDSGRDRRERDRDKWRDGIPVLMWPPGPSKVENLDIIDSYVGRAGILIRMWWNVLYVLGWPLRTSEWRSRLQDPYHHHHHHHHGKYWMLMFVILPHLCLSSVVEDFFFTLIFSNVMIFGGLIETYCIKLFTLVLRVCSE